MFTSRVNINLQHPEVQVFHIYHFFLSTFLITFVFLHAHFAHVFAFFSLAAIYILLDFSHNSALFNFIRKSFSKKLNIGVSESKVTSSYFWQASAWKAPVGFQRLTQICWAPRQDDGAFEDKLGLTKLVSRFRKINKTLAIAPKP